MFQEFFELASMAAQSQFVFSILFILLFLFTIWFLLSKIKRNEVNQEKLQEDLSNSHNEHQDQLLKMMKDSQEKSAERERDIMDHNKTLMEQLNRSNNSLERMADTMEDVSKSISNLQKQQEMMQLKNDKEFERLWYEVKKD
ncbi:hypothetical protein vBBak6_045 [Bacillus phage v_B-Bak6]|uniref:Uncharacterized protein n=2 Tax=Basiliskvirus TaxID=3044670 RepID=A0A385IK58_9CAUD|nr:involved in bacteriocin production or immunity [Bacillus phage Basilisk]YP_010656957.1 involved in bacteriocin production or immunity [Bacillus phage v_B-Bak10]AXY83005.1 hypothetical protein vBBak1_045 [Bacillus phage v_B-Bak1]AXY83125.1 hypothetical protein vBBak6_045 [Bacillus phage v_B-Bak6]AGR46597.1 hypothetical protein BASILISK_53 [Bacillus phage Basilisk]AXY83250.1 hypothetical protein vBBBak10_050 [Bacillus phage v_B-Bak10]